MEVDIVDMRAKYIIFEEGIDFVIEEATGDLQDEHDLVSDLEFFLSFLLAHATGQLRSE